MAATWGRRRLARGTPRLIPWLDAGYWIPDNQDMVRLFVLVYLLVGCNFLPACHLQFAIPQDVGSSAEECEGRGCVRDELFPGGGRVCESRYHSSVKRRMDSSCGLASMRHALLAATSRCPASIRIQTLGYKVVKSEKEKNIARYIVWGKLQSGPSIVLYTYVSSTELAYFLIFLWQQAIGV